ncbi:MAG TPA: alpha/beta hydrolase [Candidatus Acidoferrales bacterium]|nr:alpha/beta hydrolase [Candidatus Acidoferrales bacterium]
MSRRTRIVLKSLALLFGAALVSGIVYEQLGERRNRRQLPQIGRSVDIGRRTLNISCLGTGAPAVIFESGGDAPGLEWASYQTEVSKFTEACWYDRAGIGWSDPGPYPRTSAAIARDLHALLKDAGVPSPYVLAGASFGGLNSRVHAGLFPHDVAGIVLIDSAHEDESLRAPKFYLAHTAPRILWHPFDLVLRTAAFIGLIRLSESSPAQSKNSAQMSPDEGIRALRRQPKSVVNNITTGVVLPESYDEARATGPLGDIPLIVLTAGQPFDFSDPELNRQAAAYQQVWIHEMQAGLARLSTRGRQIVVPNANHGTIPQELTVSAIREVVTQVRGEAIGH